MTIKTPYPQSKKNNLINVLSYVARNCDTTSNLYICAFVRQGQKEYEYAGPFYSPLAIRALTEIHYQTQDTYIEIYSIIHENTLISLLETITALGFKAPGFGGICDKCLGAGYLSDPGSYWEPPTFEPCECLTIHSCCPRCSNPSLKWLEDIEIFDTCQVCWWDEDKCLRNEDNMGDALLSNLYSDAPVNDDWMAWKNASDSLNNLNNAPKRAMPEIYLENQDLYQDQEGA